MPRNRMVGSRFYHVIDSLSCVATLLLVVLLLLSEWMSEWVSQSVSQ